MGGPSRQQVGGFLVALASPVLLAFAQGGAAVVLAVGLVALGLAMIVQPNWPWVLPLAFERDARGVSFRLQRPRLREYRRLSRDELRARAEALSRSLYQEVAAAKEQSSTSMPPWVTDPQFESLPDAERVARFNQYASSGAIAARRFVENYKAEYGSEALWLYQELRRRVVLSPEEVTMLGMIQSQFEQAVNLVDLEAVARYLGVWAKRL